MPINNRKNRNRHHRNPVVAIGKPFPFPMKCQAVNFNIAIDEKDPHLYLDVGLPSPPPQEIEAFRTRLSVGVYHGEDLPEGVILARLATQSKKTLLVMCAPVDPSHCWRAHPHGIDDFLRADKALLRATLVNTGDPNQRGVSMIEAAMPPEFKDLLRECWQAPDPSESGYWDRWVRLKQEKTPLELWEQATKFC